MLKYRKTISYNNIKQYIYIYKYNIEYIYIYNYCVFFANEKLDVLRFVMIGLTSLAIFVLDGFPTNSQLRLFVLIHCHSGLIILSGTMI